MKIPVRMMSSVTLLMMSLAIYHKKVNKMFQLLLIIREISLSNNIT